MTGAVSLKGSYWLIYYMHRRIGREEWSPANMAWYGTPGSALKHLFELNDEYNCEHVVVSAMPISKAEYTWMKDHI